MFWITQEQMFHTGTVWKTSTSWLTQCLMLMDYKKHYFYFFFLFFFLTEAMKNIFSFLSHNENERISHTYLEVGSTDLMQLNSG